MSDPDRDILFDSTKVVRPTYSGTIFELLYATAATQMIMPMIISQRLRRTIL